MNELITISSRRIGEQLQQTVNARHLHALLGVKRDFNRWMKDQIRRARLVEGRDYLTYQEVVQTPSGAKHRTEYAITIDSAKHIGMMSGTDKGFEIRDYFIECERVALAMPSITLDVHNRVMAYERRDKVTQAMARLGSRHMLERKEALKDLREEKALLEDITQLRLFLAPGVVGLTAPSEAGV